MNPQPPKPESVSNEYQVFEFADIKSGEKNFLIDVRVLDSLRDEVAKWKEKAELSERILSNNNQDWAIDDSAIRDLARKHLGDKYVNGDSYGVPPMVELVEKMEHELRAVKAERDELAKRLDRIKDYAEGALTTDLLIDHKVRDAFAQITEEATTPAEKESK